MAKPFFCVATTVEVFPLKKTDFKNPTNMQMGHFYKILESLLESLPGRDEQRSAMVMIRLPTRTISQIRNLSPESTTRSRNPKPTVNATNWGAKMNCKTKNRINYQKTSEYFVIRDQCSSSKVVGLNPPFQILIQHTELFIKPCQILISFCTT